MGNPCKQQRVAMSLLGAAREVRNPRTSPEVLAMVLVLLLWVGNAGEKRNLAQCPPVRSLAIAAGCMLQAVHAARRPASLLFCRQATRPAGMSQGRQIKLEVQEGPAEI